jgi:hypothetical protein
VEETVFGVKEALAARRLLTQMDIRIHESLFSLFYDRVSHYFGHRIYHQRSL